MELMKIKATIKMNNMDQIEKHKSEQCLVHMDKNMFSRI